MKKYAVLFLAMCSLGLACQPSRQTNVSVNGSSPVAMQSPTVAATINPSPSASPGSSVEEKEGEYNGYHYFYKTEGDSTVALFAKRFLPRDDTIFVGAVRDVIRRVYKEETYGQPRLVNTTTLGGTAVRAIRFDGSKNGYVVIPVKEDTGEVHSLTITRVAL